MLAWGLIVFAGLWLILADIGAVRKAKLMGNPILAYQERPPGFAGEAVKV